MKALICAVLILSSHLGFAAAPTLADDMDQISVLFKNITANAKDSSQNSKLANEAAQLVTLFTTAQSIVPDSITQLPVPQQAAAILDYKSLIQNEIDDANALQKAFSNGDNNGALSILSSMSATKGEGHSKYAE